MKQVFLFFLFIIFLTDEATAKLSLFSFPGNCLQFFSSQFKTNYERNNLKSILSSNEQQFTSTSNSYGTVMADAVLAAESDILPGNFVSVYRAFINARIQVVENDIKRIREIYGTNAEQVLQNINERLRLLKEAITRTKRPGSHYDRGITIIKRDSKYSSLYSKIEKNIFENPDSSNHITVFPEEDRGLPYIRYIKLEDPLLFSYEVPIGSTSKSWTYKIQKLNNDEIIIWHGNDEDIENVTRHLSKLWDEILSSKDIIIQLRTLAEFEWWFMAVNIPVTGGASLGDALSISLQRRIGIPLRSSFEHLDFEVLSRGLYEYIDYRVQDLLNRR